MTTNQSRRLLAAPFKNALKLFLALQLLASCCDAFLHARVINGPSECLFSSNNGGDDNMSFTYVEGSEFDNPEDEIEALGGDPFFLMEDEDQMSITSPEKDSSTSDKGKQDDKDNDKWEWDGEVDENAHLDLDID